MGVDAETQEKGHWVVWIIPGLLFAEFVLCVLCVTSIIVIFSTMSFSHSCFRFGFAIYN